MQPRTKEDWNIVLTAAEWFLWLVQYHTPRQIIRAMRAATKTLKEVGGKG